MAHRTLSIDRDALLAAVTARGEQLLGTWLELADGSLHALVDGEASAAGVAFEARMDRNPDGFSKVPVYAREYRLMSEFVETVDDDPLAARLDAALAGREAFRRFEAVLSEDPAEQARWRTFRGAALEAWATTWLRGLGLRTPWMSAEAPTVEPPALLSLVEARTVTTADRASARELFVRLARELCELSREPFRTSDLRGRSRFVRPGIELSTEGNQVTVSPSPGSPSAGSPSPGQPVGTEGRRDG